MSYCVCVCGQYFWFEAKLWCDCPFWLDDLRDSCVCECLESEFPESFQKPFNHDFSSKDLINQEGKPQAVVNHTLDAKAFKGWVEVNNPWTNDDETDNGGFFLVNNTIPPLWRQYFQNTQGLMFVVDNNDRDQVVEVRNELHRMLNEDELHDAVLLVFDSRAPVQPLVKGFTGGLDWLFNNNANKV
ncbi:hypothetical protein VitviT2T_000731 [Vitis vinifera]|uniref:Uncharacterized protein n=1 Tax=Vitis vinifera TaxID=29760 RepID=A0ABY9BDP0_VITVI|nr:hypothetical protein VitviT2T_000731 [Vitis vinifera]